MRRRYAFEAEGVPEKVENALEKLEDQVDENCDTVADCEKAEKKIDDKIEEFDGALQAMAGAAKDCKDGKCSKEEMGATIKESMTDLKNIASEIGVANESDSDVATEEEIKDAKAYLEGAKEIVEAKKDELENGDDGGSSKEEKGKDKDDDDDDDEDDGDGDEASEEEGEAVEAFVDICLEAYLDDLDGAMEAEVFDMAMEGVTSDALSSFMQHKSQIKSIKAEMKAADKAKDYKTAAAKAKEAAGVADQIINDINGLPAQSIGKAVLVNIALAIAAMIAAAAAITAGAALAKVARGGTRKIAHKLDKMNKKAKTKAVKAKGAKGAKQVNGMVPENNFVPGGNNPVPEKASSIGNDIVNAVNNTPKALMPGKSTALVPVKSGRSTAVVPAKSTSTAVVPVKGSAPKVAAAKPVGTSVEPINLTINPKSNTARNVAAKAGGTALAGAAVGGAATAGSVVFLKKKGVVDADGNSSSAKLDGKDVNGVIALMKIDAKKLKQRYLDLAAAYEEAAANAASSSATEAFLDSLEGFMIAAGIDGATSAMESESGVENFDSFLDSLWD